MNKLLFFIVFPLMAVIAGCASLPDNVDQIPSFAFTNTEDTRLGQRFSEELSAHPGASGFILLGNGLDAFVSRSLLAQAADRSIDAQYYLLHKDLTGWLFIDQLLKAADRGVRVRLLVDDMDLAGRDWGARMLDSHPNVEVRIFNPFSRNAGRFSQFITRFGTVTRRMHNKSFTVDNQLTILGGRNIGDEYFEADPNIAFGDIDVLAIGSVAHRVSSSFDQYWNHKLAYPVSTLVAESPTPKELAEARQSLNDFFVEQNASTYLQALRDSPLARQIRQDEVHFRWGNAQVVADHPEKLAASRDKTGYHLASDLKPHIDQVRDELIIFSPYFVPGKTGVALLQALRKRGVRVRILTNSLASTDVAVVHAGYARYRKALLRAGVELYEMDKTREQKQPHKTSTFSGSSKASLHAKSFVLDRKKVFIGSLNLDPRSLVENSEIGVVFDSSEIAIEMADWFDQNIRQIAFEVKLVVDEEGMEHLRWHLTKNDQLQVFDVEPHTSLWQRMSVGLLRLLPIESQL